MGEHSVVFVVCEVESNVLFFFVILFVFFFFLPRLLTHTKELQPNPFAFAYYYG